MVGRILGQQLLENKILYHRLVFCKGAKNHSTGYNFVNIDYILAVYLVDIVFLNTSPGDNDTFGQLLQFQVMK